MMTYLDCVNYILDIPKFSSKTRLEDVERNTERINLGEHIKVIHVAGTDGKGSVTKMIATILKKSGYKVGMFVSPHLVKINERIVYDSQMITDDEFVTCFEKVRELISKEGIEHHPSYFEFLFYMALFFFKEKKPDYLVLETGLGGRLDATNSVKRKDLCVITGIGFDHTEYLGDTLSKIAGEKAGIIKPGIPVAFWDDNNEASLKIKEVAGIQNSRCYPISRKAIKVNDIGKDGIDFSIGCSYYRYDSLKMPVKALYQTMNAALAILSVKLLNDDRINDEAIYEGLKEFEWPGRMEEIYPGIYLDGAHNPHGIKAFLDSVKSIPCRGRRKLVFSVVSDKQYEQMIGDISSSKLFDKAYVPRIDSVRALGLDELERVFDSNVLDAEFFSCSKEAVNSAILEKKDDDLVFIVGSLYLAGEIKNGLLDR